MKNHTICIADFPKLSDNSARLISSIKQVLNPDDYELIYIAADRSHAEQLNMALDACRTKYILFVDNDAEFLLHNANIFEKLDEFWEEYGKDVPMTFGNNTPKIPTAGSASFGHVDTICATDESPETPYFNFFVTSFKMSILNKYLRFDESFEKTQCVDVAWFRAIRYQGYLNYAVPFLNLAHHHSGGHADYVDINQKKLVKMFGCATDAAPERSENGWEVYKKYLNRKFVWGIKD